MSTRWAIAEKPNDEEGRYLYIHNDGCVEHAVALVAYCKARGYRPADEDPSYAWARLAYVACVENTTKSYDGLGVGLDYGRLSDRADLEYTFALGPNWTLLDAKDHGVPTDVMAVDPWEVLSYMEVIDARMGRGLRLGESDMADALESMGYRLYDREEDD